MVYNSNPKHLALLTSLIVTLVVWLVVFLLGIGNLPQWLEYLIGIVLTIAVVYLVVYRIIENFIYKKVKLIYKTIHNSKRGHDKGGEKMLMDGDVIAHVNQEVKDWAESQQGEIDELRQKAQYRREFLGNVSHELKTPIFNIQGYILTLLDGGIDDKEVNRLYLERSEKSVNRMIAIVNDLETISSLESAVLELKAESFNVITLAHEVCEFLEIKARKRGVNLSISRNVNDTPIVVIADMEQIRRVLINLVDNAIKYIGDKEEKEIKINFFDLDENILVEVEDNGMGISEINLPRLFERFFRVEKGRSREQGGTGLGLAIVKHVIEAHNQTINVRSKEGVGTTFGFTLRKF